MFRRKKKHTKKRDSQYIIGIYSYCVLDRPVFDLSNSLQNKIWNLPDRSTILPKFIYDTEGKLAGRTQIFTVSVHGPSLILNTEVKYCSIQSWLSGVFSSMLMVSTTRNFRAPPTQLKAVVMLPNHHHISHKIQHLFSIYGSAKS